MHVWFFKEVGLTWIGGDGRNGNWTIHIRRWWFDNVDVVLEVLEIGSSEGSGVLKIGSGGPGFWVNYGR